MIRIALLVLLAAPAAAQDLSVDPATVRACLDGATRGEVAPECIGEAANTCQGQEGGSTTQGIVQCLNAEMRVWDDLLNAEYGLLRDSLQAEDELGDGGAGIDRTDALRDAQRAWIAFRDADCALAYARWQGGTIRGPVSAGCQLTHTARRALELRDMRRNGEGDL